MALALCPRSPTFSAISCRHCPTGMFLRLIAASLDPDLEAVDDTAAFFLLWQQLPDVLALASLEVVGRLRYGENFGTSASSFSVGCRPLIYLCCDGLWWTAVATPFHLLYSYLLKVIRSLHFCPWRFKAFTLCVGERMVASWSLISTTPKARSRLRRCAP